MALMNAMRDMLQLFLLYQLLINLLLPSLIQQVLMMFGLCHFIIIDYGTPFKCAFVAMCKNLDLNYDILAKRNDKELTVEHFHRFLNKVVAISMEDRESNDVFVMTWIAVWYMWNSAPINGTEILRSTIAIGREFRFPIDIKLSALPQLTQNNAQSSIDYLRLANYNLRLSSSILKFK